MQRGDRPDHRHRAGAVRGVRADRVPRRPDRRAVPPVRGDDLDRGGDLRHRRADAHAGAVRADPEARAPAAERGFFAWFNRWFARVTDRYSRRRGVDDPARRHRRWCCSSAWWRVAVWLWRITPGSLVPDEDQGFYIARGDPARRRDAASAPTRWSREVTEAITLAIPTTRTSSRSPASTSSAAASATTPRPSSSRRSTGTSAR